VWSPIKEPSRVTSRHHRKEKINIITEDRKTENTLLILNINTKDLIIKRTPTPHIKGHGLIVTIWKE
jgi:predicted GNAT family acetyltransferase